MNGLSNEQLSFLEKVLIAPLKQEGAKVYLFGSRATGNHAKFSDIDLLYMPGPDRPISEATIYLMLEAIEDSDFPFKVELVNETELAQSYRANVMSQMIEL